MPMLYSKIECRIKICMNIIVPVNIEEEVIETVISNRISNAPDTTIKKVFDDKEVICPACRNKFIVNISPRYDISTYKSLASNLC